MEDNTANLDADVANGFFDGDANLDSAVFIDPTITVNGIQVRRPVLCFCEVMMSQPGSRKALEHRWRAAPMERRLSCITELHWFEKAIP